jgi:hypothetical protein
LSRAVAKIAGITFRRLAFSYWMIKPWFLTKGKFSAILIIPSSWGSQRDGDLHRHLRNKQQDAGDKDDAAEEVGNEGVRVFP